MSVSNEANDLTAPTDDRAAAKPKSGAQPTPPEPRSTEELFGGGPAPESPADSRFLVCAERLGSRVRRRIKRARRRVTRARQRTLRAVGNRQTYRGNLRRAETRMAELARDRTEVLGPGARKLPTTALVLLTLMVGGLDWWLDQGALELLYLGHVQTMVLAAVPTLLALVSGHLAGRYLKSRDRAGGVVLVSSGDRLLGCVAIAVGIAISLVIGGMRWWLAGPVGGILFTTAALGLWAMVTYAVYLWESPQETRRRRASRSIRHWRRMIGWASGRITKLEARFRDRQDDLKAAAAAGIGDLRTLAVGVYDRHDQAPRTGQAPIPEWLRPIIPLSRGAFPPDLELTDQELDPDLTIDLTDVEATNRRPPGASPALTSVT